MAGYFWNFNDNAQVVTYGTANAVTYVERVVGDDWLYKFNVAGAGHGVYHVHTRTGTHQVTTVRWKQTHAAAAGDNLVVWNDNQNAAGNPNNRRNLHNLAHWCGQQNYPNHQTLLDALHAVMPNDLQ